MDIFAGIAGEKLELGDLVVLSKDGVLYKAKEQKILEPPQSITITEEQFDAAWDVATKESAFKPALKKKLGFMLGFK